MPSPPHRSKKNAVAFVEIRGNSPCCFSLFRFNSSVVLIQCDLSSLPPMCHSGFIEGIYFCNCDSLERKKSFQAMCRAR